MQLGFSFQGRTEQLIASGRVVLASFSLLAIWLDPSTPSKYADLAYALLAVYVVYALAVAVVVLFAFAPHPRLPIVTHVIDLGAFSVFAYFTEGPTSPFFVYFVFSLLCATVRWQWRGTLWTATVALTIFLAMGFYAGEIQHDPAFELNRFLIRAVYFVVIAALLGYLGADEFERRRQLSKLASWSRTPPVAGDALIRRVLERAAGISEAPRLLMAWEEEEEPWLYLAAYSVDRFERRRESPGSFSPLVASELEGKSFISHDAETSAVIVVEEGSDRGRQLAVAPLNSELRNAYEVQSVLSVPLAGENLKGRLFFLDKPRLTADDLTVAEILAGQSAASMDLFYFFQRQQQTAATEERLRIARDLHDGALQSLGAAGMRLQALLQTPNGISSGATEQLQAIQEMIRQEQRDLRFLVDEFRLAADQSDETSFDLAELLEELRKIMAEQWRLNVEVKVDGAREGIPPRLARDIYFIVREGLINAARHAQASAASVELGIEERGVRLRISDNGHGFPFKGAVKHSVLVATGEGPAMIKGRVAFLGGTIDIYSTDSGACLEISLPLAREEV